jgi:serine/threonine protein kinase
MTLGTKLGPYEIRALLGAGGMGEVYRAYDTKLKRDVALKVLPETFTRDSERLARFQREAEVLASLNHPNIAQIYGRYTPEATTWVNIKNRQHSQAVGREDFFDRRRTA